MTSFMNGPKGLFLVKRQLSLKSKSRSIEKSLKAKKPYNFDRNPKRNAQFKKNSQRSQKNCAKIQINQIYTWHSSL